MSVADRLRVESEQAYSLLQESHRAVEEHLSQALSRQREKEKELETLRAEHRDVCQRLSELTLQQQLERAELDGLRNSCTVTHITDYDEQPERQDSEEGQQQDTQDVMEVAAADTKSVEMQQENEANQDVETQFEDCEPEDENGSGNTHLTGKGVAEGYIRSLAALEKKKEEERGQRDPRKIVMLSERSW